ncbi:hypothetical protein M441DRAFT_88564 [Trichoderma asperellum CBS 433.97]|uniref:Uncharacterized protein n=1 Tax=Trichoderma asperellum (strain ATCC 204424 / CBS 433.97 / NBRC 101777) TaxID=1042311 RepID=A0A2T3ZB87_TRIA4|nr:hypothetical protein M441DRAFT_88564 [Trichoderma asperellum CBS 433.97]PTB42067.1 hypothetical protein M441DRAFT_88564 [Trichoderma asperellum CBS 433.97]
MVASHAAYGALGTDVDHTRRLKILQKMSKLRELGIQLPYPGTSTTSSSTFKGLPNGSYLECWNNLGTGASLVLPENPASVQSSRLLHCTYEQAHKTPSTQRGSPAAELRLKLERNLSSGSLCWELGFTSRHPPARSEIELLPTNNYVSVLLPALVPDGNASIFRIGCHLCPKMSLPSSTG